MKIKLNNKFDIWTSFVLSLSINGNLKKGEIYMKALLLTDSTLYKKIENSEIDCTIDNLKCNKFVNFLKKEWGEVNE